MARTRGWGLGLLILATVLAGCRAPDWFEQTAEKAEAPAAPRLPTLKTIGDYSSFIGLEPIRVSGIGVVTGLKGTGSNPPPGPLRQQALHHLKRLGVEAPEELFKSGEAALVGVTAYLPPGVRPDDRLDVEVELLPADKATSLKGGTLLPCDLHEYVDANAATGRAGEAPRPLQHSKLAKAEGPVLMAVGAGAAKDEQQRRGRVWGGGRSLKERGFELVLGRNNQSAGLAVAIAKALNDRFHTPDASGTRVVAEAMTNARVVIKVPDTYRLNWPRYLRVLRTIPVGSAPQFDRALSEQLGRELEDPKQAVHAALQLEALGRPSVPALKRALKSPQPLTRFCAAEALAYLGDPACAEPLAELVRNYPEFRAYGLTALASLDEAVCHLKLRELLLAPSPETRYGAFRALRMLNAADSHIQGEPTAGGFWLHRLALHSPGLVHVSTSLRPEVVIFGEEPRFVPPFSLRAGNDFILTAKEGEDQCIVSRYSVQAGRSQRVCSLKAAEIIATLGDIGASYGDVVDLLQQAASCQTLSCAFAVDAMPVARPLIADAADAGDGTPAKADLGDTPNLFSRMGRLLGDNR
jgi:hypothetical protein